jgi:hypothetical protein
LKVNTKEIIIVALILIAIATIIITTTNIQESSSLHYTDEELQALYEKYNITENDLKYAKGELPPLTITENDSRVIATDDGLPPEDLVQGVDYDIIYTQAEWRIMIEKAKNEYIEKYGVDPSNPKLDFVGGYYLPIQEIDRLAETSSFAFL